MSHPGTYKMALEWSKHQKCHETTKITFDIYCETPYIKNSQDCSKSSKMVQHFGSPYIPEHFVSNSILGQPVDLIAATGQSSLVALGEPFVTFFSPYPLKPTVMHYYSPIKSHGHGHIILFQNQIPCFCFISSFGFPPHIMDSLQYLMQGVTLA